MKRQKQKVTAIFAAVLIMTAISIFNWFYAGHAVGNDDRLIVWFFDIGQGDAIFIESPSGFQMLIDGGPGDIVLDKLSAVMPFWDRTLDAIILTHPHADHLDGLVEVVDHYAVESVYWTHVDYFTPSGPEFARRIDNREQVIEVTQPLTIDLGGWATFSLIYPEHSLAQDRVDDVNASSIVGLLTYGETSVLLTGDITAEEEPLIAEAVDGQVDVLKVAHHGSAYSSTAAFLADINPEVAVISVGADNDYGHPHPLTLDRLAAVGAYILRTDQDGDIRLTSEGGEPTLVRLPL